MTNADLTQADTSQARSFSLRRVVTSGKVFWAVLFVLTWGVCLASSLLSGLFCIGLADVLPSWRRALRMPDPAALFFLAAPEPCRLAVNGKHRPEEGTGFKSQQSPARARVGAGPGETYRGMGGLHYKNTLPSP